MASRLQGRWLSARSQRLALIIGFAIGLYVYWKRTLTLSIKGPLPSQPSQTIFEKLLMDEDSVREREKKMFEVLRNSWDLPPETTPGNEEIGVGDILQDNWVAPNQPQYDGEFFSPNPNTEYENVVIPAITGSFEYKPEPHPIIKASKTVNCRHRWTKYLLQNHPKPNEKLDALLKRYNRLHDKHLKDQSLQAALELSLSSRQNKIRYLAWIPAADGVLAGQLLSLVSAFLFALLTDRVLLVDLPEGEMEHVICQPFLNSSWYLPVDIKAKLLAAPKAHFAVRTRQPFRMAKLSIERGNPQDDKHLLSCHGTLKNVFSHIQWLIIESNYSFIESIQTNRAHQNQLNQLFGELSVGTLYSTLHRYLIHPSNFVWEKITMQYHTYFSDHYPRPLRVVFHSSLPTLNRVEQMIIEQFDWKESTSIYSVPASHQSPWIEEMKQRQDDGELPSGLHFGSSASLFRQATAIHKWRQFLTDLWMTSWATFYMLPINFPTSAIPGLWMRNKLEGIYLLMQTEYLAISPLAALPLLQSFNQTMDVVDCSLIKKK